MTSKWLMDKLNYYDYNNDMIPDGSSFKVGTIQCPKEYSRPDIILDVNTKNNYLMMKYLYENIYPIKPNFKFQDIIDHYDCFLNNSNGSSRRSSKSTALLSTSAF